VVINFNQRTGFVDFLEETMARRRTERVTSGDDAPVESRFFKRPREQAPPPVVVVKRRRV